jgi:hypothetical protein
VCGGIEVAPGCAALGPCRFRVRVDPHAPNSGEVNDNAAVVRSQPRAAMTSAPDRQIKAVVPCVPDGGHHIPGVGHSHHHGGTFVDHAVVDQTGVLVVGVAWSNHLAPYVVAQFTRSLALSYSPNYTITLSKSPMDEPMPDVVPSLHATCDRSSTWRKDRSANVSFGSIAVITRADIRRLLAGVKQSCNVGFHTTVRVPSTFTRTGMAVPSAAVTRLDGMLVG